MSPEKSSVQIAKEFGMYVDAQKLRLDGLSRLLADGLVLVSDTDEVNRRLQKISRTDLVITQPAKMMPVDSPDEILGAANNFTPNFQFYTGVAYQTDEESGRKYAVPVPITSEEIDRLRTGSVTMEELIDDEDLMILNHANKPAFQRMLVLFPEFVIPFMLEMSKL